MSGVEISAKRARPAVVCGWVAFGVSLFVGVLVTLAMWFYGELPMLLSSLAEEEGFYGEITMDMINPEFIDGFFEIIWWLVGGAVLTIAVAVVLWARWFSKFVDNRISKRMGGYSAVIASMIPGFGVFIYYFVLKDALAVLQMELAEREYRFEGVVQSFSLWVWTAVVTLGFLTFCKFDYWLMVLFVEMLCYVCFFRFVKLISAVAHEEGKLL